MIRSLIITLIFSQTAANAQSFELNDLVETIERNHVQSIDQLIPLLPEGLRRGYTLFKSSAGLQSASEKDPRAILYGDNGRLVLSFNGDPQQAGYNDIELYQVNPSTFEFEFYRLSFPLQFEESGKLARPVKNPAACLGCHGTNPRPIWGNYPNWKGAYGERDDLLSASEKLAFEKYLTNKPTHPRYSQLLLFENYPTAPFRQTYMDKNYQMRPGVRMGALAIRWNNLRLARRVQSSPEYKARLPLLMYTMNTCKPLDVPIPEWNWSQSDVAALKKIVPKPDESGVLSIFGLSVSDFDMARGGSVGMDYSDGTLLGDARTFLMGALMKDFLATRPQLSPLVLWYPDSSFGGGIIQKTPFDREFSKTTDSISIPARFRLKTCPILLEEVRASLNSFGR